MVTNFTHFHPVGVVLVAMLGIGVAEHTGFINAGLRAMLAVTATVFLLLYWAAGLPLGLQSSYNYLPG